MKSWVDDFFGRRFREYGFETIPPEKTRAQAEFIAGALDLRPGDTVLDICCGVGRHSLELAKLGFRPVGMDITGEYLKIARNGAPEDCTFLRGDMRSLPFANQFPGAFNFFTSWGYYGDEDNFAAIQSATDALMPGGRFLLEVINRDYLVANFAECGTTRRGKNLLLEHRRLDFETSIHKVHYIYFENGEIAKHDFVSLRVYSLHEIYTLYRRAGLEPIAVWGSSTGGEFLGEDSMRIAVLGEKE